MIKCPQCKKIVSEDLKVCSECGYSFDGTEETVSPETDEGANGVEEDTQNCCESESTDGEVVIENETKENDSDETKEINESLNDSSTQNNDLSPNTEEKKERVKIDKRVIIEIAGCIILIISLIWAFNLNGKNNKTLQDLESTKTELEKVKKQNETLESQKNELSAENSDLKNKNDELENGAKKQLVDIKNAYENGEWQNVIDLTAKLHDKYNGSQEDTEAQEMARISQEKIDEANAAKAEEEARGYETGITYDQLARTPDDFNGQKVKFYGKVVQVIEGGSTIQIRLAVDDNYDTILFGEYNKSIVASRVLEDDYITIYGTSVGTISYKSTMGGTITIPGVNIEKIDQ